MNAGLGGFSLVLFITICAFQSLPAHADDDCDDVGKLGMMLGQIDKQCASYQLTTAGRKVMLYMAARTVDLGGEACTAKGKVAMPQQLGELFPNLEVLAASGDTLEFNRGLCDAIAKYLNMVTSQGNQTPMVEHKR